MPSEVERLKTRAENNRQEFWQLSQEEGKELLLLAVRILFFFFFRASGDMFMEGNFNTFPPCDRQ